MCFHRTLHTKVLVPWNLTSCLLLIEEKFPAGVYVDPDELNRDLDTKIQTCNGEATHCTMGRVNVETFEQGSKPLRVYSYTPPLCQGHTGMYHPLNLTMLPTSCCDVSQLQYWTMFIVTSLGHLPIQYFYPLTVRKNCINYAKVNTTTIKIMFLGNSIVQYTTTIQLCNATLNIHKYTEKNVTLQQ
jgi:hypothetical protein